MSLIFHPKVPARPRRTIKNKTLGNLSDEECNRLVELRAIATPYYEIEAIMGRSYKIWQSAPEKYGLTVRIANKRAELTQAALNPDAA
jgi:hypothetical protein|tara:strand:+ start:867 stop:1130 length:264 start_codon:yes stop_codon:yes gene_type:complete